MTDPVQQVVLATNVGELRLIKTQKHKRFAEFRKRGKYAWTLARDNALTRHIEEHLRTDLAGSVALNLFNRASLTWFMAPSVALSHDPDDVDRVEETPVLHEAAQAIADALRAEIDVETVTAEAVERIGGEFLHRTPSAIQIGRATKAAPDHPERCFGRLAPLGVTSVAVVAPWLGYVPALGLTDWFYWRTMDLPWLPAGPEIEVEFLDTEVWVRPQLRAAHTAVEAAAVTKEVRAATKAPEDLPVLRFEADRLEACEPLGLVFATNLRIVSERASEAKVTRILPLHLTGVPWDAFPDDTPGIDGAREAAATLLLCPFSSREALQYFAESKELLVHFLWLATEELHVPVDPWEYAAVPPGHVPGHETRRITYFDFDETGYRAALAEIFLSESGTRVRETAIGRLGEAFRKVRRSLTEAGEAVSTARSLGVEEASLTPLVEALEAARAALADDVSWKHLAQAEVDQGRLSGPEPPEPRPVTRETGSAHRSVMPDGTLVESRDERFEYNLQTARKYYEEYGHLRPAKSDRPRGINLYQWLKNQELRIRKGTMPEERKKALESIPGWRATK